VYLQIGFNPRVYDQNVKMVTTEILGKAKVPKAKFENPDGSELKIDTDYFGAKRSEINPSVGPFENPDKSDLKFKIW